MAQRFPGHHTANRDGGFRGAGLNMTKNWRDAAEGPPDPPAGGTPRIAGCYPPP